ncbi:MAG TPA: DUF4149 domain-containing protein [Chitinophagaceae bacterium]
MLVPNTLSIAIPFIWAGLVAAISFIEAPVKFKAPGVTLPIGLSIGKRVFSALNKTEWGCMVLLLLCLFFRKNIPSPQIFLFVLTAVIILLQSFWLLPALDRRAKLIIGGQTPPPSFLHYYYVAGELIKMICLIALGWLQL